MVFRKIEHDTIVYLILTMKYLVAMSGGIDSSVAAVKLKKEGHEVVAVHLVLWAEDMETNKCCSTDDMCYARQVAARFGIPFYNLDLSKQFKKDIVEKSFLDVYKKGMTPNPCVSCNREIRFGALIKMADDLGMDKVCTGHYSIVEEAGGTYKLKSGVDKSKDQSYFLHGLTQKQLARIYFPLGNMTKIEVIELAAKWDLINTRRTRTESQDLCFIPEKTPAAFLKRHLDKKYWDEGNIIDRKKKKLGRHKGLPLYTIGQRKGIDIGGLEEALYVIAKDEKNNTLVLGTNSEGLGDSLKIKNVNLITDFLDQSKSYSFKIRYGGSPYSGKIMLKKNNRAEITLDKKVSGITPGQFVAIYDGEYCLGGGEIIR